MPYTRYVYSCFSFSFWEEKYILFIWFWVAEGFFIVSFVVRARFVVIQFICRLVVMIGWWLARLLWLVAKWECEFRRRFLLPADIHIQFRPNEVLTWLSTEKNESREAAGWCVIMKRIKYKEKYNMVHK